MTIFRIFVASPGDVLEERKIVREVVEQLRHERAFRDVLNLQIVAWDQPGMSIAMPMATTPQQAIAEGIPLPSECDLLVMILWSRMGTLMPEEYVKKDGSRYFSGTEWEYYDALQAYERSKRPKIWMYRRTEELKIDPDDSKAEEKYHQYYLVQQFYASVFNSDGSISHGVNNYKNPSGFRQHLTDHLRDHLVVFLQRQSQTSGHTLGQGSERVVVADSTLPEQLSPIKGRDHAHEKSKETVLSKLVPVAASEPALKAIRKHYPSANKLGEDRYGCWLTIKHKSVEQKFRWIPPGTFMMGSPDSEQERHFDETPHQVTLSQGFWLANTAVSQAFWFSIMGNNPSHFKGTQRPVEMVSWEDTQTMIYRLRRYFPDLLVRLPYEAEWEYACRAGTTSPFSWGQKINTDWANYNGDFPYNGDFKGEFRQHTVAVNSFLPNFWGLHQMHGNVWEWCQDFYGRYPGNAVIDPVTTESGALESNLLSQAYSGSSRVMRGGAWLIDGKWLRSAARAHWPLDGRMSFLGFRLALDSKF